MTSMGDSRPWYRSGEEARLLIAVQVREAGEAQPAEEQHCHGGEREKQVSDLRDYHGVAP